MYIYVYTYMYTIYIYIYTYTYIIYSNCDSGARWDADPKVAHARARRMGACGGDVMMWGRGGLTRAM